MPFKLCKYTREPTTRTVIHSPQNQGQNCKKPMKSLICSTSAKPKETHVHHHHAVSTTSQQIRIQRIWSTHCHNFISDQYTTARVYITSTLTSVHGKHIKSDHLNSGSSFERISISFSEPVIQNTNYTTIITKLRTKEHFHGFTSSKQRQ